MTASFSKATKHTRAGRNGRQITCPHCKHTFVVHHFAWSSLVCQHCSAQVNKTDFLISSSSHQVISSFSLEMSFQDLALLATVLNKELNEIERKCPGDLQDEDSYAHKIKLLHRRILSFHN